MSWGEAQKGNEVPGVTIADAEGGVDGFANVGAWGDGTTTGRGRPGVVSREMGMIALGPAVDWSSPELSDVSSISLCSLAWLTLLTTPAVSPLMTSLAALIKSSLSLRSASSALEPESEEVTSSIGERGTCFPVFERGGVNWGLVDLVKEEVVRVWISFHVIRPRSLL